MRAAEGCRSWSASKPHIPQVPIDGPRGRWPCGAGAETPSCLCLQEGVKTENDHINLKVAGQDGSVVQFKIKRHTPLSKLMKAYCERQVRPPAAGTCASEMRGGSATAATPSCPGLRRPGSVRACVRVSVRA